ncbi:molecular chaperone [Enterobacter sp. Cy-643]|uniref:fimbrial biogenesis chaperone n=1 Tax=Enterobacter sp. Cy-643 TaxID=2608346 RepID=UPI001423AAD5|nr:molecular chaperone [Enterobacter sp. Cy-643]NIF31803.1 molecular chaperone [Enterobacter sp. Cy-643]
MTRYFLHISLATALLSVTAVSQAEGFGINTTRLVYPQGAGSINVTLRNGSAAPMLAQSAVSRVSSHAEPAPFTVIPPLVRLEPNSKHNLRILENSSSLPADRESVFYFRASAIPGSKPGTGESDNHLVRFGIGNSIKLFYRPKGLPGTALDAQKNLQFSRVNQGLKVTNTSPYHVSFAHLSLEGKNLPLDKADAKMIAPFASYTWPLPAAKGTVKWVTIDDHGGDNAFSQKLP